MPRSTLFAVVRAVVRRSLATKAIERPFRILGVQIAIGSEKGGPLTNLWQDIFNAEKAAHRIVQS
jgi:hypothetical protein